LSGFAIPQIRSSPLLELTIQNSFAFGNKPFRITTHNDIASGRDRDRTFGGFSNGQTWNAQNGGFFLNASGIG
jgi:hypothetical protein